MNTHNIELPPLPEPNYKPGAYGMSFDAWGQSKVLEYAKAAIVPYAKRIEELEAQIEADRKQRLEGRKALQDYMECGGDKESDPIERLRFYCSLAMSGQDWLDAEQFFDSLIADRKRRGEPVALTLGHRAVAAELLACFRAWEPMVYVLGNVMARDGADLMQAILNAAPQPADPVDKSENMQGYQVDKSKKVQSQEPSPVNDETPLGEALE